MTLADFLLARLSEVEAIATEARDSGADLEEMRYGMSWVDKPSRTFVRHVTPRRVLADVAAKRAIVAACARILEVDGWEYRDAPDLAEQALYNLAQPWRDHPDFNPAWTVS